METAYLILENGDHDYRDKIEFKISFVPSKGDFFWVSISDLAEKLTQTIFSSYRNFITYSNYMCYAYPDTKQPGIGFNFCDFDGFYVKEVEWIPLEKSNEEYSMTCCITIEPNEIDLKAMSDFEKKNHRITYEDYLLLKRNTYDQYGIKYTERRIKNANGDFLIESNDCVYRNNKFLCHLPFNFMLTNPSDEEIQKYLKSEFSK